MVIFKYPLDVTDVSNQVLTLEMPAGANVLCVQVQCDGIWLWAEVDVGQATESRRFVVLWTGGEYEVGRKRYVGTVQTAGGDRVWHVFELLPVTAKTVGARTVEALEDLTGRMQRGERIPVTRVRRTMTPDGPMHTREKGYLGDDTPRPDQEGQRRLPG